MQFVPRVPTNAWCLPSSLKKGVPLAMASYEPGSSLPSRLTRRCCVRASTVTERTCSPSGLTQIVEGTTFLTCPITPACAGAQNERQRAAAVKKHSVACLFIFRPLAFPASLLLPLRLTIAATRTVDDSEIPHRYPFSACPPSCAGVA